MTTTELLAALSNITEKDDPRRIKDLILSTQAQLIIPILILGKGTRIFRASSVTDINDITSYQRLSYKPASLNHSYQRASTPSNTMFYGIISTDYQSAVAGCLGEICDCLRQKDAPHKHYSIIISEWELKNDVALVQMLDIEGKNKSVAFANANTLNNILDQLPKTNRMANKAFLQFIANEFKKICQKESDYWISATYTEFLTQTLNYDGIIYESVQAIDPALQEVKCVAFTPQFTDNNLTFLKGDIYEFDFNGIDQVVTPHTTGSIIFSHSK